MVGFITLNIVVDGIIQNPNGNYPVLMYYNGDESKVTEAIFDDDIGYGKLFREKYITFEKYSTTEISWVSYFANDHSIDSDEKINHNTAKLQDLYIINDAIADILIKDMLLYLAQDTNIDKSEPNFIRKYIDITNLSKETITRAVDKFCDDHKYNQINKTYLLNYLKKLFENG